MSDADERPFHEATFDPRQTFISRGVIEAVATLNDADSTALDVRADFVDSEALDALVQR